jgi:amino acid permease
VCEASLALVSSIVGGGIVGVPFSMLTTGIPFGIFLNISIVGLYLFSGHLYLKAMKMSSAYVESLYQMGYLTLGKSAIYMFAAVLFLTQFGMSTIYFVVFGDIASSIVKQLFYEDKENFLTGRYLYVMLLGLSLFPIVI